MAGVGAGLLGPVWRRPFRAGVPRPANPPQGTLRIATRGSKSAASHHPNVTEREVVFHRVPWIERPQRARDVRRHLPSGRAIPCQAQTLADSNDVRIERNHEPSRGDPPPHAEVDTIGAHHPAEKEIQSLAGAPGGGARKEIADARP
jgi:hypothetical protein